MDQQSPTPHSGILHETRLLEAYEAIAELPAGELPPHWRAELTASTLRAYQLGLNIPTDGSSAQRVFETYDQIEKARDRLRTIQDSIDEEKPASHPTLRTLTRSSLRLLQAQNAIRDYSIELEDRLNPDHPLTPPARD